MDYTFVSCFTARPVPINVLYDHLATWEDYARKTPGVDYTEATRKFIVTEGDYSSCVIERIFGEEDESNPRVFGFEGTQLLADDCTVKTRLIARMDDEKIQGEIYVTIVNLAPDKPLEKRFFSLWNILNERIITECSPFLWTPLPAPKILLDNNQLIWFLRVINRRPSFSYVDTREAREKFMPKAKTLGEISAETTQDAACENERVAADDAAEVAAEIVEESPAEATDAAIENVAVKAEETNADAAEPTALIAELKMQLEGLKSENEDLSEKNEQLVSSIRKLKTERKTLGKNVEDQKNRIRVLKKRVEQAEARAKDAVSGDMDEFCEYFDRERERLEEEGEQKDARIEELERELDVAKGKITSLKGRLNKQNSGNGVSGLLAPPEGESEKYENEFGIAVFSALHKAIEKTPTKNNSPHARSIDVWQAIIDANPDLERAYEEFCDNKDALKNAIVAGELEKKKHLLKPFNLDFDRHTNCHPKITFGSDPRYLASAASTASETGAGFSNCAKDLRNTFLFPT